MENLENLENLENVENVESDFNIEYATPEIIKSPAEWLSLLFLLFSRVEIFVNVLFKAFI